MSALHLFMCHAWQTKQGHMRNIVCSKGQTAGASAAVAIHDRVASMRNCWHCFRSGAVSCLRLTVHFYHGVGVSRQMLLVQSSAPDSGMIEQMRTS